MKKLLSILFAVVLVVSFSLVTAVPAAAITTTLYEHYNTGDDSISSGPIGDFWYAQTFTAVVDHTITSVKLKLGRVGSPGNIIVSIRATDAEGHPTGSDLTSGTTDGNTLPETSPEWREITMPDYTLTSGTEYAIVFRAPDGYEGNYPRWCFDSEPGGYADGHFEYSANNGATWTVTDDIDFMFEVYGPWYWPTEVWVDDAWSGASPGQPVDGHIFGLNAFDNIQDGIDAVAEDGMVNVAAGTYTEDITVNKYLTLEGAQAGIDPRGGRAGDESEVVGVIVVTSAATDVVFDGFKFTSPTRAFTPRGFNLRIESESSTVTNNIFVAEENAGHTYSGYLDFEGITNATVTQNSFSGHLDLTQNPNVVRLGITGAGIVTVADNEMRDVGGGGGIGIMCSNAGAVVNIHGNVIENTGNECIWVWNPGVSTFATLSITSNDLSEATKNGIKLVGPIASSVEIEGNDITNNPTGILVQTEAAATSEARFNNITGNMYGVVNEDTDEFNATKNWWGSTSGPTHASNTYTDPAGDPQGNAVSDLVDFVPWLDAPYPAGKGFAPVTSEDGEFSSIQAAIDVASGTTITCAAGTFSEVVTVDKSLTLLGANAGVCAGVNPGERGYESVIQGQAGKNTVVIASDGVTVDGFEVDGNGEGIFGIAETTPVTGTTVKNNIVHGFIGIGIAFAASSSEGSVLNNEVTDTHAGVYLSVGATNILIQGNRLHSTVRPTDKFPDAGSAVVFEGNNTSVIVTNNALENNNFGLFVWNFGDDFSGTIVSLNNISGNVIAGVQNTSGGTINAINNWWGDASGPSHSPGYGDRVSDYVLYDPWLLEPVVPGEPLPTTFDKTLTLLVGWTLVSTDNWIDPAQTVGVGVILAYNYTPSLGYFEVTPADLVPVNALYLKTEDGGALGITYSGGVPVASSKELEPSWNLISSATVTNAKAVLSPLRYVQVGEEQGVGMTTLVSQGQYNLHTPSFYLPTLTDADWDALGAVMLSPFDGYWVYMNAGKVFGVIPD